MSVLLLRAICNFAVLVGRKLRFGGRWMSHAKKEIANVILDGQATRARLMCGGVVPFEVNTSEFFTLSIFSNAVVLL